MAAGPPAGDACADDDRDATLGQTLLRRVDTFGPLRRHGEEHGG